MHPWERGSLQARCGSDEMLAQGAVCKAAACAWGAGRALSLSSVFSVRHPASWLCGLFTLSTRFLPFFLGFSASRLLLEEAMDQFRAAVGDGSALRQSLIHGDVNEQNLLVNQDETEVVGVLDFGDCSESWLVSEPAIAATYLMLLAFEQDDGRGGAEPIERCAHFLRAYEAEMPLQEAEVAVFRELCLGRLVQSLMMGAISAAENPENAEYTLITARHGWRLLEVLLRYRGFHRLLGRGARTHP